LIASSVLLVAGLVAMSAAPPTTYYAPAAGKSGGELRKALHELVRSHNVIPYASSSRLDTSDALKVLDRDPLTETNVVLIYSGYTSPAAAFGLSSGWNREHQWCDSYGLDGIEPAYSDLHNLRACDANVNSSRGNKFYDTSDPGAVGYKPSAFAEAPLCSTDSDSWEAPEFDRGNIARSLFYMAIRYTGDKANEPELILTDDTELIQATNSYMGKLSTLLEWHVTDPVDDVELLRNDRIYSLYQTNRNPFVDHPEWVNLTFAPPATNPPTLNIAPAGTVVVVSWLATNQSTRLEYSPQLGAAWSDAPPVPELTNGQFQVTWTNTSTPVFFRLRAWP
jgi:endonuclease I